jgi:hypothetical protein
MEGDRVSAERGRANWWKEYDERQGAKTPRSAEEAGSGQEQEVREKSFSSLFFKTWRLGALAFISLDGRHESNAH